VSWLEELVSNDGMPSAETAMELAGTALDEAHAAHEEGDEMAHRYYMLMSGQALDFALTARIHERLLRIEAACPGLKDDSP